MIKQTQVYYIKTLFEGGFTSINQIIGYGEQVWGLECFIIYAFYFM